jgi:hypothetical protein
MVPANHELRRAPVPARYLMIGRRYGFERVGFLCPERFVRSLGAIYDPSLAEEVTCPAGGWAQESS